MLVSGKKRCLITSRAWVIGINCEIAPNHDGKIDVGKKTPPKTITDNWFIAERGLPFLNAIAYAPEISEIPMNEKITSNNVMRMKPMFE